MCFRSESGQATLEAAFLLPVLLVVFGVFLQPMLLLYDRCVMQTAAAETCRMLATSTQDEQAARVCAAPPWRRAQRARVPRGWTRWVDRRGLGR